MRALLLLIVTLIWSSATWAGQPLRIYLDADRSTNISSARSIEIGIRSAFADFGSSFQGREIEFVPLDHRGNSRRTKRHLQQFLMDEDAVAVIGGLHSPPYLKNKDYVNDNGIPLLLPWSAAAPLTRNDAGPNSIFRLSLDDSIAAEVIVPYALDSGNCTKIALLLWESGWGKSNEKTMSRALLARGFSDFLSFYFPSGLTETDAISLAGQLQLNNVDCAILVGNAPEGEAILRAVNVAGVELQMFSHWGITGGAFEHSVASHERDSVKLTFIQPCFDFAGRNAAATAALHRMIQAHPEAFTSSGYISAPAGLFHGYDLGRLLVHALESTDVTQPMSELRENLVTALEQIDEPVDGLLREYVAPFSAPTPANLNAHEALDVSDFCMARFDAQNQISPFLE